MIIIIINITPTTNEPNKRGITSRSTNCTGEGERKKTEKTERTEKE